MVKKLLHEYIPFLKSPINSIENNLKKWSDHDWSKKGEEWSNDADWKNSLVEHILIPNIPQGCNVLEIGPGAGRWTEYLLSRSAHLIIVDLTPKCIELCKQRFGESPNIEYYVNDGKDLSFIQESSLDRIWSFDVFVHIQAEDIEKYIEQFAKLLKPGGQGVIHHSKYGVNSTGWRSDMTAAKMVEFCQKYGLEIVSQFNSWDNSRYYIWPNQTPEENLDIISIFSKPF